MWQDGSKFHQDTQNSTQLKLVFISRIFHSIFSDQVWSQVTKTKDSKTTVMEGATTHTKDIRPLNLGIKGMSKKPSNTQKW